MGLFSKKTLKPGGARPVGSAAPMGPVSSVQHIPPWNAGKFKIQLDLARTRIELTRTQSENKIKYDRRVAADHLRSGKDELARLLTEKTLRGRAQLEAFDIVTTYLQLLIQSARLLGTLRGFDSALPDVKESVASLVYAGGRLKLKSTHNKPDELMVAINMLRPLLGADVIDPIAAGDERSPFLHCVNRLLSIKLESSLSSPDPALVRAELIGIAAEYNVDWTAPPDTFGGVQPPYNPNPFAGQQPPPPPNAPPGDFGAGGFGGEGGGGGGYGGYNTAAPVNPSAIPGMPPAYAPAAPPIYPSAPSAYAPTGAPPPPSFAPAASAPAPAPPPAFPDLPPGAPPAGGGGDTDDFMARFNKLKNN